MFASVEGELGAVLKWALTRPARRFYMPDPLDNGKRIEIHPLTPVDTRFGL